MRKALALCLLAASLFALEPTPEMVAAVKKGDAGALKIAVNSKEEANAALLNGKNLLMLSVWEGKTEVVKYLLEKGADVNAADEGGKTPLMLALWRENIELAKLLISKGADKSAKNKEGMGIADIAQLTGNGELIDYVDTIMR